MHDTIIKNKDANFNLEGPCRAHKVTFIIDNQLFKSDQFKSFRGINSVGAERAYAHNLKFYYCI